MDLTQYKIETIIEDSKKKVNLFSMLHGNLKFFFSLLAFLALVLSPLKIFEPFPCLFFTTIFTFIKTTSDFLIQKYKINKANRQLEEVVQLLEQHDVHLSKTKLEHVKVASNYISLIANADGYKAQSSHVIMLKDNEERLVALRQARVELMSFRIPFQKSIIGETTIIKDEEKAKQLYIDMKKR